MGRKIEIVLGLAAFVGTVSCYNTLNVTNGGLSCGIADSCPDGFTCRKDQAGHPGHCWKDGTGPGADAGSGGPDTTPAKFDAANPAACTLASAVSPFGPFATCSLDQPIPGSTCDPVCQAGCPCDQRCVVDSTTFGSFLCEGTASSASTFVPVQDTCNGSSVASCAPGSVCIADDVCPNTCFKTCRKDLDCPPSSRCSVITLLDRTSQPVPNVWLCTPPTETCNPTGTASCGTAGFACVFQAGLTGIVNTDSVVCDCATSHNVAVGGDCRTLPDDCKPGAVCVDKVCRPICDRRASGSACPSGGGCKAIYGSTQYGYCS